MGFGIFLQTKRAFIHENWVRRSDGSHFNAAPFHLPPNTPAPTPAGSCTFQVQRRRFARFVFRFGQLFFASKRIFLKFFCSFLCFDRIFRAEKRPDLCFARRPNRPFCGPNGRFRHDFRPKLEYNSIAAGKYAKKDCTNRGIAKRGGMCYNNDIR